MRHQNHEVQDFPIESAAIYNNATPGTLGCLTKYCQTFYNCEFTLRVYLFAFSRQIPNSRDVYEFLENHPEGGMGILSNGCYIL